MPRFSVGFLLVLMALVSIGVACISIEGGHLVYLPIFLLALLSCIFRHLLILAKNEKKPFQFHRHLPLIITGWIMFGVGAVSVIFAGILVTQFSHRQEAARIRNLALNMPSPEEFRLAALEYHSLLTNSPDDDLPFPQQMLEFHPVATHASPDHLRITIYNYEGHMLDLYVLPDPSFTGYLGSTTQISDGLFITETRQ